MIYGIENFPTLKALIDSVSVGKFTIDKVEFTMEPDEGFGLKYFIEDLLDKELAIIEKYTFCLPLMPSLHLSDEQFEIGLNSVVESHLQYFNRESCDVISKATQDAVYQITWNNLENRFDPVAIAATKLRADYIFWSWKFWCQSDKASGLFLTDKRIFTHSFSEHLFANQEAAIRTYFGSEDNLRLRNEVLRRKIDPEIVLRKAISEPWSNKFMMTDSENMNSACWSELQRLCLPNLKVA